jgi:peptidoglycan/LPS O-acetylase OafA/YrhL
MKFICGILSLIFLVVSVASFAVVLWNDIGHGFPYDMNHQRLGSLPFIFIGICFIFFQLSLRGPWPQRIKGILLGTAFALWGSEIFLPKGNWLTVLDNVVITIFLVDLGMIVVGHFLEKK